MGAQVAIASDSLVTFGETRLPQGYEANAKMFEVAGSYVGAVGTTAHMPVLQQALHALPAEELQLHSRAAIFETFLKLHPTLKDRFFMNTKEQDSDPYESSQFSILVANRHGIFGVESYREVFEFDRFWAIGSGQTPTTVEIAEAHAAIRRALGAERKDGDGIRILYGGSVKAANAKPILALPLVEGALVGGASLDAREFWAIVESCP